MFDIVGLDYPCVDLNINLDTLPKSNGRVVVNNLSWQGGGKVSSGLVTAARLGAKCAIVGAVGEDKYGTFCKKDFMDHGIDTRFLITRKQKTTTFSIVLSDKETLGRSFVCYPGTSRYLSGDELPAEYLHNTKYFFMAQINEITKRAAFLAKKSGTRIFVDADTYSDALREYIPQIDIFVASEYVYRDMFSDNDYEKNCRSVMEQGPEIVAFTFGERGVVGLSSQGFFRIPAFSVEVVDTSGAGDDFHGAFLAGLLHEDWSVEFIARFASAVSAIKCTRIGGRAGIPSMETTMRFLKTGEIDYTEIDKRVDYYKRGIDYV